MFRLRDFIKKAARSSLLALLFTCVSTATALAQERGEPGAKPFNPNAATKVQPGQCTGNNTIRFFFLYDNGQIDSGLSTSQEINDTNLNCVTFLDGDDDLDADNLHLSCSVDYSDAAGDPNYSENTPGNELLVEDFTIFRPDTNGGKCGNAGLIVIEKQTDPDGSSADFDFTGPETGDSFTLSDGEQQPFTVPAGNYSVGEIAPPGWDLTGISCQGSGDSTSSLSNGNGSVDISLDLVEGENDFVESMTCVFTNTQVPEVPDLRIEKTDSVDSVPEGTSFSYTLTVHNDGDTTVNSYTVSDDIPANTTFDSANNTDGWSCSGGTCTVVGGPIDPLESQSFSFPLKVNELWVPDPVTGLCGENPGPYQVDNTGSVSYAGDGDDATPGNNEDSESTPIELSCTDNPATLTIVKSVSDGDASQSFSFTGSPVPSGSGFGSFSLTGQSGSNSQQFTLPGSNDPYSVTEQVPDGWKLTGSNCTNGDPVSAINLGPGDDVTCTFTNLELGQIVIGKFTEPTGSQTVFNFTRSYGGDFDLIHGEIQGSAFLEPGQYTATETVPTGWQLTDINCLDNNSTGNTGTATATINLEAGEQVRCNFTNTEEGSITVVKATSPDESGANFNFTTSQNLSNFTLTDNAAGNESKLFASLLPDDYSVTEQDQSGWELTGLICSGGSNTSTVDSTASISLAAGEDVTCTFTNTQDGSITIAKATNPDESGATFGFSSTELGNFDLIDNTAGDESETFNNLQPGEYTVSENGLAGWVRTDLSCSQGSDVNITDGSVTIDLSAGESVTCTYTNTQDGTIEVVKTANPDDTGTDFVFDLGGDATDQLTITDSGSDSFTGLQPGSYTVTETVPEGWELTSETCAEGVELSAGETVTCEFTNVQDGSIEVVKTATPDNTGTDFVFTLGGDGSGQVTITDSGSDSFTGLQPGSYSVTEAVPAGWELTSETCASGVELSAGETVTCEFTNVQDGSIEVVKTATPDNTGTDFVFTLGGDGSGQVTITDSGSDSFTGLQPGSYSVTESVPAGWELTSETCSGGVELAAGEVVTCEFDNRQLEADLSVVKSTNGQPGEGEVCQVIEFGEPVVWTYEVTNTGEQPLDIQSIIDDAGTPGESGDDFTPNGPSGDDGNGLLDPGETWSYEFTGSATVGEYINTALVTAQVTVEQQPAAKADIGTIIERSASSRYCGTEVDLAIEKTDGGALTTEGGTFSYTLSYENLSNIEVTGVTITETVPENTQFSAADSTNGWSCADGAAAGTSCTFDVGTLAAGATGSVEFGLQVLELVEPDPETGECPTDPPDFKVDNTASIADDGENGTDVNPENNQDSDDTPIATECEPQQLNASIVIEKSPEDQLLEAGDTANFTIKVTNNGDADLVNVVVEDFKSPDCNRNIGDLAIGAMTVYNCEMKPVINSFTNVATVTGEAPDSSEVSDEDDADVSVLNVDEPEQQHHPIPTMSQWGLILMAGLMLMLGVVRAREWTRR